MSSRPRLLLLVVLLVLIGAAGLVLTLSRHRTMRPSLSRAALVWDVPGDLADAPSSASTFSLAAFRRVRPSLWEVTSAIRSAAADKSIRALVLHVGEVQWGWARAAEVREALATFRAAGKPIYVSLQGGADQSYLLAASGTRVAMPPTTSVYLDGLTVSAMFLKGTYDKLGIKPNFSHVGQFKSAVEQYTRTDLSPPARAALESLLDDQYTLLVDTLAAARRMTPERMRAVIDEGPFTARAALAAGLVDTLLDQPELDSLAVAGGKERLRTLDMDRYLGDADDSDTGDQIALIPAAGTIVSGRSHDNGWSGSDLGSETLVNTLREACERRAVKAIVLWVDSPGGSGEASDDVWQEIRRVRRVKPVVVSMSNLAASGGYYIACGADAIVAQPGTITGSIGVFGGKLNVLGLYQKLGLNIETVSRGRHAEMMSQFRDFTPEESGRFQAQLDEFYRIFVGRVAQGRGLTASAVDSIGQGRVWSGTQARRLGLVDSLGGVRTAIGIARKRAHLSADADVPVVIFPHPHRPFFRRFVEDALEENQDEARVALLPPVLAAWVRAARFPVGQVLAMMPYELSIR
jgi:protease-4